MKPLLYVAGPYSAATSLGRAWHVAQANLAAALLMEAGYNVLVPHQLGLGIDPDSSRFGEQRWYDLTMDVMLRCDGVVLLPTWERSRGARSERDAAIEAGIPVYELADLIDDVPEVLL